MFLQYIYDHCHQGFGLGGSGMLLGCAPLAESFAHIGSQQFPRGASLATWTSSDCITKVDNQLERKEDGTLDSKYFRTTKITILLQNFFRGTVDFPCFENPKRQSFPTHSSYSKLTERTLHPYVYYKSISIPSPPYPACSTISLTSTPPLTKLLICSGNGLSS